MIELYPCFKNWKYFSNIWLYSDTHFNDPEMVDIRKNYIGDEAQVNLINSKVGKKDIIIFLGDIGDIEFIKKIKGYKVLVLGNHDKGTSNYERVKKEIEHNSDTCPKCGGKVKYDAATYANCGLDCAWCDNCGTVTPKNDKYEDNKLFDEVYPGVLFINEKIVLSHEPVNIPFAFNIHGHNHSNWEGHNDAFHLNVCAEHINYTPISLLELVKQGKFKQVPNIHRMTIDGAIERKKHRKCKKGEIDQVEKERKQ